MTQPQLELVILPFFVTGSTDVLAGKEILIHTKTHILETATSNIALQTETGQWLTPRLDREKIPFLDGVMRRYLLKTGTVREGEVTMDDFERARQEERRIVGFNGLR